MPGLVFAVPHVEIRLAGDDIADVRRELKLLAREGATYDAAGAESRIAALARKHARVELDHWPHAELLALARALDHLWNLDRVEPPPLRHRPRHELREYVTESSGFDAVTYDRVVGQETEIFHSYSGPYEPSDRIVDLSGLVLRVASVEQSDPHERLICVRDVT
jgi:hypothetical protein